LINKVGTRRRKMEMKYVDSEASVWQADVVLITEDSSAVGEAYGV
jgi:hypothetical protein